LSGQDRKSIPRRRFHLRGRQRKLPLYLATVETVIELYVVPAANPQIAGHVTMEMTACKVHAAHVRTVCENASKACP
jgi:alkylhydroperoxidase family enzyme